MKRALALLVITLFIGYGVVRVGVGAALLAQATSLIDFGALAGAVTEVAGCLAERTDRALVPISVPAYFAYIMAMGALLVAGGWGALLRRPWGYVSLATYLVLHAGLFVNYQEVNPKLVGLAISMVAVGGLAWLRPPERLHPSSA